MYVVSMILYAHDFCVQMILLYNYAVKALLIMWVAKESMLVEPSAPFQQVLCSTYLILLEHSEVMSS